MTIMKKWIKYMILILVIILVVFAIAIYLYLQQAKFGRQPLNERLARIEQSAHYQAKQFQNLVPMMSVTRQHNALLTGINFIFRDRLLTDPQTALPSIKMDLTALSPDKNVIIWLGHSTFFIRLEGKTILIDPVLSQDAAPIPWINSAFKGTDIYKPEALPNIDYVLISHDHWDHLDYPTINAIKDRVKQVVVGLGVGEHFAYWGYDPKRIYELDWYQQVGDDNDFAIHFLPAQHFSGRLFDRNQTLWGGFAIITPNHRLFFSGDSGYGPHFGEIGRRFNRFDIVMLDSGQYDENWPSVHMFPEQAARAAQDLHANALLPGHIGKFSLAYHSWDDPFKRITRASQSAPYRLLTPMLGEPIDIDNQQQKFSPWWQKINP